MQNVETIPAILTAVTIGIFLCIVWLGALKAWRCNEAYNELMAIWERFRELEPSEMKRYLHYEDSFFIIAKDGKTGKKNAFEAAYTIGYLEGKGEAKHE